MWFPLKLQLPEYHLPGTRLWTPSSVARSGSFVAQKKSTPKQEETKQMAWRGKMMEKACIMKKNIWKGFLGLEDWAAYENICSQSP